MGVDIDAGMLDEARRRLPGDTFVEGDMRSFRLLRTFDAVSCLFSSIGYMSSERDLHDAVATMATHLRPGGVLVIDGWIRPDAWNEDVPIHLLTAVDETVTVARMSRSRREGPTTFLEMHHLIGSPDGIEYAVDTHVLTLFDASRYEQSLENAGLIDIETIESPMPGARPVHRCGPTPLTRELIDPHRSAAIPGPGRGPRSLTRGRVKERAECADESVYGQFTVEGTTRHRLPR